MWNDRLNLAEVEIPYKYYFLRENDGRRLEFDMKIFWIFREIVEEKNQIFFCVKTTTLIWIHTFRIFREIVEQKNQIFCVNTTVDDDFDVNTFRIFHEIVEQKLWRIVVIVEWIRNFVAIFDPVFFKMFSKKTG